MKFQINQKVTVFDNKGIISDTTDAPKQYGVTFDATGKTYAVTACHIEPCDIKDEIKTLDDAIAKLGENNTLVKQYRASMKRAEVDEHDDSQDLVAFLELRIITAALNDGWQPTFADDEYRYYPWFCLYTEDEYNLLDEDKKKQCCRVVGRSVSSANAHGGLVYASAYNASSYSSTRGGSRLVFKTRDLALYAGKQFLNVWCDFLF